MARQMTTPKQPPRSGPKRRDTREGFRPTKLMWFGAAAALVLIAGLAAIILLPNHARLDPSGNTSPEEALAAAGCTYKTYPDLGQGHVDTFTAKVKYNSVPPTSGTHYYQPAIWGMYSSPVQPVQEVHNLEHGGIVIHYGNKVSAATKAELAKFYDESPNGMLLSPLPSLGDNISVSAWTRLANCQQFNEKAFTAFRTSFRAKGPEQFRLGDLAPGS